MSEIELYPSLQIETTQALIGRLSTRIQEIAPGINPADAKHIIDANPNTVEVYEVKDQSEDLLLGWFKNKDQESGGKAKILVKARGVSRSSDCSLYGIIECVID